MGASGNGGAVASFYNDAKDYASGKNRTDSNNFGNFLVGGLTAGLYNAGDVGYRALVKPSQEAAKASKALSDQETAQANNQLAAAQKQQADAQAQSANATAAAQARVRSIQNSNPDGLTLMTPKPSVGSLSPTGGKATLGG